MKKRLLSIALALALALSLVPVGWAANVPNDVNYYELNPYTNAQLVSEDADGTCYFKITIAADGAVQCCPMFLWHVHAYAESSDKNVAALATNGYGISAYAGRAPGTATVKFWIKVSESSQYDCKAVIDVTVLSAEDFAAYTGSDATRSTRGHDHTITVAETPNPANNEMLRREVCTQCGYWCNLSSASLPGSNQNNNTGAATGTNTGTGATTGTNTGTGTTTGTSIPINPASVISGVNSVSTVSKTAYASPCQSSNINAQNYPSYAASTVKSYLYENAGGGLTRVEYISDYQNAKIVVEEYDSSFQLKSAFSMTPELPIWGGFYAGKNYNYMVFGQANDAESDSVEVIRVVKYSKDWSQRLGQVSLRGGNTTLPFRSSSLRFAEEGDFLYIRTAHQMYTSASDGKRHQANVMLSVRQSDMSITDAHYIVGNAGYVSHSFNQFVLADRQGKLVTLDHGDAYPRSLVLHVHSADLTTGQFTKSRAERVELVTFPGATGANQTGCAVGGFAETSSGYVAAYSYDGNGTGYGSRDLYLSFTSKSLSSGSTKLSSGVDASAPQLASTGLDGGYVLWTQRTGAKMDGTLYYAAYDASGGAGTVKTASAALSDCVPIQYHGNLVWYVTDHSTPVFYTLSASGVTSVSTAISQEKPSTPTQQPGTDKQTFTDVPAGEFFADPVAWAVEREITKGTSPTTFSPYEPCTQVQILTFLWRAAGRPASQAQAPVYVTDSDYAGALRWATEKGMIDGSFNPNTPCTRATAVTYIWQAFGSPSAEAGGFTDVPSSLPYAAAVAWAVAKNVTQGTTKTTFTPGRVCNRGEIVTFLYRAYR